jgi:pimeloyl-ACP methyl ester carboxylesterase
MKSIYKKEQGEKIYKAAYYKTLREWEVSYTSYFVMTRFGSTHVIEAGAEEAEVLVLLYGFAFSSTMWKDNIKDLSSRYHVYALDFIGDINLSVGSVPIKSKEECAQWFYDVLKELEIEIAHVMGMSYGGFLSLVFAAQVPEKIEKIITICPGASFQKQRKSFFLKCLAAGLFPSEGYLNQFMDEMCAKRNIVNPALRNQFIIGMKHCVPRIRVFASLLSDEELKKVTQPTLLIYGEEELQYDPKEAIKRAAALLPDLKTKIIKRAGPELQWSSLF